MEEIPPPCEEISRDNFKDIFSKYDTILIYIDGVVWRQDGVGNIAGAGKVCDWLVKEGKDVFYLSNRDNSTREELRRCLTGIGVTDVSASSIFTAASVLASAAASKLAHRNKVYVVGGKGLKAELDAVKVQNVGHGSDEDIAAPLQMSQSEARRLSMDPEVTHVAVGSDPFFNSAKGFKAASYILRGAKLLVIDEAGGRRIGNHAIPGTGAVLAFLRVTVGPSLLRDGLVFGLPHTPLLRAVREMLPSLDPRRTLVIGDSLTDHVAFARDHGLDALLVKTGSADDTQIEAMKHATRKRKNNACERVLEGIGSVPSDIHKKFKNVIVIFIVGGPGCGKGTQCDKLKSDFGLTHISSGDLLREEVASGSELGKKMRDIMERGDLVPMIDVLEMIKSRMLSEIKEGSTGFLIDGYPREEEQGVLFESMIRPCHVTIYYNAFDDTMLARMRKRAMTSGRADDNEYTMRERLKTFHKHAQPVVEYFKKYRKLIEIDAEAETAVVYQRTVDGLKRMFLKRVAVVFVVGGPGCGKGTQCDRLKDAFRLQHISSGDLLREEVASGSTKGKQLKEIMDKGELVSMKMVLDMIRNAMIRYAMMGTTGFLLDGYPREEAQAVAFETEIRPGTCCISYVLDNDEMLRRMRHRAKSSGRSDDNETTMNDRLKTFHKHAEPIINCFKGKEKLIQIYAGEPIDVVFNRAVEGMSKLLLRNVLIIFIVGGPGCGKGTQCGKLSNTYSLTHISSGDLLREEVASGSAMGKELHQMMVEGILVPMETVVKLIQCAMLRAVMTGSKGFLIDGFPREERQALYFESLIGRGAACVYFNATEDTMLQRMRYRGANSGRADDNEATMRSRLKTYRKHAEAVVEYFRDTKRLVEINADAKVETVFYETCLALRAKGIHPGLQRDDLPAYPRYILDSLGDIAEWIYTKPPRKPATPSTCCCKVLSPSEERLNQELHPHPPSIVTIIGSPGSQRPSVVQHVAKQFGLLNMDEEVVMSETINSKCDYVRDKVRNSERARKPITWNLLTQLLRRRLDNLAEVGEKNHKSHKGIVLGLEAREDIFSPKTEETLLGTVKLISDSAVISYLVSPRDAIYRKHVLQHVSPLEQRFRALDDVITTPNWANVWTKYVKVNFGKEVRKKVQTTDANRTTPEICAEVDRHICQNFLSDLTIVFLVGGPGSGKSTLASKLAETYLFRILDIEELVGAEIASDSLIGKSLKADLVAMSKKTEEVLPASSIPFSRVAPLVRNAVVRDVISGCRGFVVDGFPTSQESAILFGALIAPPKICLCLQASERTMIERSVKARKDERESVIFDKVTGYVGASSSSSPAFLDSEQLAPLVEKIAVEDKEDAIFDATVKALHKRRIYIPQHVAARLKKKQLEEEERLLQNAVVLFVIGGPGCGKSLLSDRLREMCNFTPISLDRLVRQEAAAASSSSSSSSSSNVGAELAKMLEVGGEVDLDTSLELLRTAALKALRCGSVGLVIDGFPKNLEQGLEFENRIASCTACLHLSASDATLMERCIGIVAEEESQIEERPSTVGLKASVKNKITDFRRGETFVLQHYSKFGKLISVNAEEAEEDIFKKIVENLREKDIMKPMK